MKWLGYSIFSLLVLGSCAGEEGEQLLKPEKMSQVLKDFLKAEIYVHDFLQADSVRKDSVEMAAFQQQIFKKHKISREQFIHSFEYYSTHGDQFMPLLDSMLVRKDTAGPIRLKNRERFKLFKE